MAMDDGDSPHARLLPGDPATPGVCPLSGSSSPNGSWAVDVHDLAPGGVLPHEAGAWPVVVQILRVLRLVLLLLLQFALLAVYSVFCMWLTMAMGLGNQSVVFQGTFAVIVGIVGPITAILCFAWSVATAIWPHLPNPRWMRSTFNTAPVLAHCAFVVATFMLVIMAAMLAVAIEGGY